MFIFIDISVLDILLHFWKGGKVFIDMFTLLLSLNVECNEFPVFVVVDDTKRMDEKYENSGLNPLSIIGMYPHHCRPQRQLQS